ncbi:MULTISPECIES: LacI family DNA-binding transcriptional regulator [Amycolatopsis]|uniref:LacI family transcriptional regulator n=1 Tax=Amycolatopsis japonica TaxID=208439 RepID=A0A075UKW3_9PSEU|nr:MULTISPECIES: LacI family DNA-binding transcriptional regulator [Amycolatopsis]AIG74797.1 LacI family transcriptional regulator [Amycolatopsis japonica]OKJ89946.1 LacI family transcriptional regulator [Amycolatopsis sp. CB00013]
MARPTMEDVAAKAGVSRALVSLVMRNAPNVSDERRTRVLCAAHELGYEPHAMARSLASRTSTVLGVMVSDLRNAFFADVVEGLDAAAEAAGFHLILNTGGRSPARERAALKSLLSFRPAGVILLSPVVPASAIEEAAAQSPVVLVSRTSRAAGVDTVNDDGEAGSALAVDHLVSLGHKRIAHLDGGLAAGAAARRRGYLQAMRRHRLHPVIVHSEHTDTAGEKAVHELLSDPPEGGMPTALVAGNDFNAVGAISALEEVGLRVPEDVSVVGYDNTSLAALRHLSLTTVDQPRTEMGRLAVEALLERIRGERAEPVRHLLHPSLVVRSTTAAPER